MTEFRTPPAWRRTFLRELARTGSVTSAARACGVDKSYPYEIRKRNPAFAASWDRALARARAGLAQHGAISSEASASAGAQEPVSPNPSTPPAAPLRISLSEAEDGNLPRRGTPPTETPAYAGDRTVARNRPKLGPNEAIWNSKSGHPCVVRVGPSRWSAGKEAVFLAELTATANVKAAARAAGVTPSAVYQRRKQYPAFKAEWEAAISEGFARIETLLVCAATTTLDPEPLPERANEGPEMTVDQALKIWLTHRAGGPGAQKRRLGGLPRREPDIDEVRAEIMRKVAAIKRARSLSS